MGQSLDFTSDINIWAARALQGTEPGHKINDSTESVKLINTDPTATPAPSGPRHNNTDKLKLLNIMLLIKLQFHGDYNTSTMEVWNQPCIGDQSTTFEANLRATTTHRLQLAKAAPAREEYQTLSTGFEVLKTVLH